MIVVVQCDQHNDDISNVASGFDGSFALNMNYLTATGAPLLVCHCLLTKLEKLCHCHGNRLAVWSILFHVQVRWAEL